jgi:hypothetical protein
MMTSLIAAGARGGGEASLCDARPRPRGFVLDNTERFLIKKLSLSC